MVLDRPLNKNYCRKYIFFLFFPFPPSFLFIHFKVTKNHNMPISHDESTEWSPFKALRRVMDNDTSLTRLSLDKKCKNEQEVILLFKELAARVNNVTEVHISMNALSDAVGEQLAAFIKKSRTVHTINASHNSFGDATYMAVADALKYNTSLVNLYLHVNAPATRHLVISHFQNALDHVDRPSSSRWYLFDYYTNYYPHLKHDKDPVGAFAYLY